MPGGCLGLDISRVEEDEEEIDPSIGSDLEHFGSLDSRVLKRCKDEFMVKYFLRLDFAILKRCKTWVARLFYVGKIEEDVGKFPFC